MSNNREWKKTRKIYFSDELNDDFYEFEKIKRPELKPNYNYVHHNIFRRILDGFVYYVIAKPILGLVSFLHGVRYKNKKNLRVLHGKGAFIYANHIGLSDVYKFQSLVFWKKVNIIGYSDTTAIPIASLVVKAFGYLPIGMDATNLRGLRDGCEFLVKKRKEYVLIYPEAHIWPFYTKIRPFKNVSFVYPAESMSPVVPAVTVFRKVWYSKKPKQTIIFGRVIFPQEGLTVNENRDYLRDECYKEMVRIASSVEQPQYIEYIRVEPKEK